MHKHYLKFIKVFTNIACPPFILILNTSELAAKFIPNNITESITSLETTNFNDGFFQGSDIKQDESRLKEFSDANLQAA